MVVVIEAHSHRILTRWDLSDDLRCERSILEEKFAYVAIEHVGRGQGGCQPGLDRDSEIDWWRL
jgi:hypothetical protein